MDNAEGLADGVVNALSNPSTLLLPPSGDGLGHFLESAAYALGGREADLARTIGVSRATLSSWKKRGAVPEGPTAWFRSTLAEKIVVFGAIGNLRRIALDARAGTLLVLERTAFDPFRRGDHPTKGALEVTARALFGIFSLSDFVADRLEAESLPRNPESIAIALQAILPELRGSDATGFA